jgi:hypothetical protein
MTTEVNTEETDFSPARLFFARTPIRDSERQFAGHLLTIIQEEEAETGHPMSAHSAMSHILHILGEDMNNIFKDKDLSITDIRNVLGKIAQVLSRDDAESLTIDEARMLLPQDAPITLEDLRWVVETGTFLNHLVQSDVTIGNGHDWECAELYQDWQRYMLHAQMIESEGWDRKQMKIHASQVVIKSAADHWIGEHDGEMVGDIMSAISQALAVLGMVDSYSDEEYRAHIKGGLVFIEDYHTEAAKVKAKDDHIKTCGRCKMQIGVGIPASMLKTDHEASGNYLRIGVVPGGGEAALLEAISAIGANLGRQLGLSEEKIAEFNKEAMRRFSETPSVETKSIDSEQD